jgi:phospholipid transport system substrate-binding protein
VKQTKVQLIAALFAALALAVAAPAFAGPGTDVVKSKQTVLFTLLKQNTPDAQKKIDAVFDEMLDYSALIQSSMGDEWAKRTDAEKADFTDVYKKLVRNAYQKNLKKILDFDVDYAGEDAGDGGAVVVKTKSKPKDPRDEPVEINFKMAPNQGGKLKVQDIVTEGQSLTASYRSQFNKIIKKDGFPALLQKMKDKLAKGDTN